VALARILAEDDVGALCLVPGVGKKTAARLLVELKSRLHIPDFDPRTGPGARQASNANGAGATHQQSARSDVREALAGLGYSADEIHGATAELPDDGDTPQLLRQALRHLATARQV
jgi:Holliday junction DNA helicase RuvA